MKRAVVFWACRNPYYLKAAKHSAKTAKRVMPDMDTVLLTDQKDWRNKRFDAIIGVPTPPSYAVTFPPLLALPEKYDSGMYVGSEAHFCEPLYDVFGLVEAGRVDIAMVHTSGKKRVDAKFPCPGVPAAFPYWRSALIAFRHHERMRRFFARWEEEFHAGFKRDGLRGGVRYPDQQPLRTALYHSDLTFATLPANFCCTCHNVVVREGVRMIAYPETVSPEKLAREANRHAPHARLFIGGKSNKL